MVTYWAGIIGTLHQRGLLRERPREGGYILPEADGLLFVDRAVFALDMSRLGGVSREAWLDVKLWAQCRAALAGRRVFVADSGGLAICVAREPGTKERRRLPAVIPLDYTALPEKPYHVVLGYERRGPVHLDLATAHRAVLIGGTSGSGKTNLLQSIVLQLTAKHEPGDLALAVIDTKEIDFGGDYGRLPHLFRPIARSLEDAARLVEAVESERLRRQALMAAAGVADWRKLDGLGLLVLVIDECADFARTATKDTIIQVARKGRAMGVSLVLGTQVPSSKVIDAQIKGNLSTRIALQCATYQESLAVLGRKGAEALNRPGLALSFLGGRWRTVQTLRVGPGDVAHLVEQACTSDAPALSDVERALVCFAAEHLDGAFIIGKLADAFRGQISKYALSKLAQKWEARGWLTMPARTDAGHKIGRMVTPELVTLTLDAPDRDIVTSVTRRDEGQDPVTWAGGGRDVGRDGEIPPFLAQRAALGG